ncbi:hypothetical protein GCM10023107_00660 [Actinoplanes octamycinicus]|uniref:PadR family transcriptional regulator n=1 Tax=Actinoplanes octamycinicus TaxID=135948 RepID=UPI0031E99F19
MLALAILGFLHDEPLHGYQLKERIKALTGHVRAVSDGALYPAINRLEAAGLLERRTEPGTSAAPRQMLSLTEAGRAELLRRLRTPSEVESPTGTGTSPSWRSCAICLIGRPRPRCCAAGWPS